MSERPILFSAPMVRAILAGSKTQTRRVFAPERMTWPREGFYETHALRGGELATTGFGPFHPESWVSYCPYGQPGDRLWVRETWAQPTSEDPGPTFYRADYPDCVPRQYENVPAASEIRWKPSIHMFRADSRINLEVTGVRVERLQDISEADAKAEGITPSEVRQFWLFGATADERARIYRDAAVQPFRDLWESINGEGAWHANPWVWVVEFKRVEVDRG